MAENNTKQAEKPAKKEVKKDYIGAIGRRKTASAQVRIYQAEKGSIEVNGKRIEEYFPGEANQFKYLEPLRTCNVIGKFRIVVKVSGPGKEAQLIAVIHGISRALVAIDEEKFRTILKKKGFLTRDPRARERRKTGMGGKARRKRQSPRR